MSLLVFVSLGLGAALSSLGAAPAGSEKTLTAVGAVVDYSATERVFSIQDEQGRTIRFVWNRETKFNGVVSVGARISVRYIPQSDGINLAQTVGTLK